MDILYPVIICIVVVMALYSSGLLARIGVLVGGPSRQDQLITAYTALTRAALDVRHTLDEAAYHGCSSEDRERLQHSVTRLQVALQPVLEAAPDPKTGNATVGSERSALSIDVETFLGLKTAAADVQRGMHAIQGGQTNEEDRGRIRATLNRLEDVMAPLAVEPFAREVTIAAEAFYEDCAREAAALDDPLRELHSHLVGTSYMRLFEAIQESSADLLSGKPRPRQLTKR